MGDSRIMHIHQPTRLGYSNYQKSKNNNNNNNNNNINKG